MAKRKRVEKEIVFEEVTTYSNTLNITDKAVKLFNLTSATKFSHLNLQEIAEIIYGEVRAYSPAEFFQKVREEYGTVVLVMFYFNIMEDSPAAGGFLESLYSEEMLSKDSAQETDIYQIDFFIDVATLIARLISSDGLIRYVSSLELRVDNRSEINSNDKEYPEYLQLMRNILEEHSKEYISKNDTPIEWVELVTDRDEDYKCLRFDNPKVHELLKVGELNTASDHILTVLRDYNFNAKLEKEFDLLLSKALVTIPEITLEVCKPDFDDINGWIFGDKVSFFSDMDDHPRNILRNFEETFERLSSNGMRLMLVRTSQPLVVNYIRKLFADGSLTLADGSLIYYDESGTEREVFLHPDGSYATEFPDGFYVTENF